MKESDYLIVCLKRVEEKFNKSSHKDWTDGDFKKLARDIFKESGTTISTHTLKRLFGKIKYKKVYNPQSATKDALAKYLAYDSWDELITDFNQKDKSIPSDQQPEPDLKKTPVFHPKALYYSLLLIAVCILAYFVLFYRGVKKFDADLIVKNPGGKVPHTVTFRIKTENFKSNDLVLNYDFVHPYHGIDYPISREKDSVTNYTYQIPGVYRPKLYSGSQIVDSALVIAKTSGWVSYFFPETARNSRWLDNMYAFSSYNGFLGISPTELTKLGRDTSIIYYTLHSNIKNFGVEGENYKLETRFTNSPATGGITCYDINLSVLCRYSSSTLRIVEKNCQAYALLEFGEVKLGGSYNDLSFLTREINDWTLLNIEVKDKKVDLFLNKKKVYSGEFKQPMGEIIGIEYRFKGSGKVDYLRLREIDGSLVYEDEFGVKSE